MSCKLGHGTNDTINMVNMWEVVAVCVSVSNNDTDVFNVVILLPTLVLKSMQVIG